MLLGKPGLSGNQICADTVACILLETVCIANRCPQVILNHFAEVISIDSESDRDMKPAGTLQQGR